MITAMVLWAALATGHPDDMDIKASLHGYNLLWPSSRCCAFDLHLAADGRATLTADTTSGRRPTHYSQEFTLTADQLLRIRQAINEAAFFDMPRSLCCGAVDGDERSITVRIGAKTHRVAFSNNSLPEHLQELQRIKQLWTVITSRVAIPGANVK